MKPCVLETTTATIKYGDERFTRVWEEVIDEGFTEVFTWKAIQEEQLHPLQKGDVELVDCRLVKKWTTPPQYLTESELITKMEKNWIGTDGSIAEHIYNICNRNYVKVNFGYFAFYTTGCWKGTSFNPYKTRHFPD